MWSGPPRLGVVEPVSGRSGRLDAGVVAARYDDLNAAHVGLWRYPGLDGLRPSQVADRLGITKQSVNDLLGRLQRHGCLERVPDSADARARVIRLTYKGRRLEETVYAEARAAQMRSSEILGPRLLSAHHDGADGSPVVANGKPAARAHGWPAGCRAPRGISSIVLRVCSGPAGGPEQQAQAPRAAEGPAIDPIALAPVDEIQITTLVDNSFDGLLPSHAGVVRASLRAGSVATPLFEGGHTRVGMVAEHGFSALVRVGRGGSRSTLLFDTGVSPEGMATNAQRLDVDFSELRGVVLSHGHFDHAGGFDGLLRLRRRRGLPLTVHPAVWTRRRLSLPGADATELPTLSKGALAREGFDVIERRVPSLLVDECVLITGEVDRTTEFERGMPPGHEAWSDGRWRHDPLVVDDQALVVHLSGRGLVVLTGCGHAGVVNIVRHAMRLTGVDRLFALIGGFHLGGSAFEPIIAPTVAALHELSPGLVVAGHCTGWRAQHALAAALPGAWVPSSAGSSYHLEAA
jgi:7,8-dihydropterin-6-yl-methyl-4-(beta-D-ribofuranosyl)aminobenzene 5'-phosphate synthase